MTTIDKAHQSEDVVANELLSAFVETWTEVFRFRLMGTTVDTINRHSIVIVYYGDEQSSSAELMKQFIRRYQTLMEALYRGDQSVLDIAIAWSGRVSPTLAPSAHAIALFAPELADRLWNDEIEELCRKLSFEMFVIVNPEDGPMERWYEAARSILVSYPYTSGPGRKWFAISGQSDINTILRDIAA